MSFCFDLSPNFTELRIRVTRSKFDVTITAAFRTEIERHWHPEIQRVVVDFSSVDFIDSSGIGALVSLQKRLNPEVSPLELVNPSPAVFAVIDLLRLNQVFRCRTVRGEANPEKTNLDKATSGKATSEKATSEKTTSEKSTRTKHQSMDF